MSAVDRYGFDLVAVSDEHRTAVRLAFPEECTTGEAVRAAMVTMVTQARADDRLSTPYADAGGAATVVGEGGLEPPHPFGHRHLKPARLPIPPLARVSAEVSKDTKPPFRTPEFPGGGAVHSIRWVCRVSSAGSSDWSRARSPRPSAAGCSPWRSRAGCCARWTHGRTLGVRGTVVPNDFTVVPLHRGRAALRRLRRRARDRARDRGPRARPCRGLPLHRPGVGPAGGGPRAAARVTSRSSRRSRRATAAGSARSSSPTARRLPLTEAIFSIGRLPDCDLTIDDALASRRHAEIRPEPDGYRLVDLGSLNGTTVNGTQGEGAPARRRRPHRHRGGRDPVRGLVGRVPVDSGALTILEYCFLALVYLFLFRVVRTVLRRAEARADPRSHVRPAAADAAPVAAMAPSRRERSGKTLGARDRRAREPRRRGVLARRGAVASGAAPGARSCSPTTPSSPRCTRGIFMRGSDPYVEDLGSTNGTLLNGESVVEPIRLRPGDRVQFGRR